MKTIQFIFAIAISTIALNYTVYSQGCSDAGVCTMNSFQPHISDSIQTYENQIKIGGSYGKADNSISAISNYLAYTRSFDKNYGFDLKITSLAQSGNDISEFNISDIYMTFNYNLNEQTTISLGSKIPLSNGNAENNNRPLPMDYQASLGTYDLIVGMGYKIDKLQLILALQQPLSKNDNMFLAKNTIINAELKEFQSTNQFERSSDLLLRISYPLLETDNFKLTPSLLPIYHLSNDKYTDISGVKREIEGSQGLTVNLNLYADYDLDRSNAIQVNVAAPLNVRDARPDGLTRSVTMNLEYKFKF